MTALHAPTRAARILLGASLALYLAAITHAAWLSDDAFIAFRAAANAVDGFGLLSNPPERVQAFTSPLAALAFMAVYAVVRDAYAVGIALGLVPSALMGLFMAFRLDAPVAARALALGLMALSAATVDFSTSGLENPLSHLLVVLFCTWALAGLDPENRDAPSRARKAALLVGWIGLSRLDLLLLILPTLAALLWRHRATRPWKSLAIGLLPLVAWELFATIYYGFPYPNTAYAKLNVQIPRAELVEQGVAYLADSWSRDPLTLGIVATALIASVARSRTRALPMALGASAYIGYIVYVGGDFMSGRFLTAPFIASVTLLCTLLPRARLAYYGLAYACLGLYGLSAPLAPFRPRDTRCVVPPSGIVDERACYEAHTALRHQLDGPRYRAHEYYRRGLALKRRGPRVSTGTLVGMTGFAAGPRVHIIDLYALTDPLLSHTPFPGGRWRIGHFFRPAPEGYVRSVRSRQNRLNDPNERERLEKIWTVVRGPLFTWKRFEAILDLNLHP